VKAAVFALALIAGCASVEPGAGGPGSNAPVLRLPAAQRPVTDCRPELEKVNAQLAAEVAERQRIVRAAARREEMLRKQLDALKAIERSILDREERMQTKAR
jgi:hypothetical protein